MGQPAGMATYHADSRTAPFFHTKVLKLKMWSEKLFFKDLLPIRWWATTTSSPPLTPAGKCSISQATVSLKISFSLGDEPLLRVLLLSPQLEMFNISSYCPFKDILPIRWWATTSRSPPFTQVGRCLISHASVPLMISSPTGDEPLLRLRVLLLSPQLEYDRYLKLLSL
jgi:hypothetical protein